MTRVYVGMSGGVDSSLSAALLIEQGYEVTGVYMKNWTVELPGMRCPWAEDLSDAKRVAVGLGIDFKVFDFEADYKQRVVDYMVKAYQLGQTPNPDIMCNQEIKFKLFLEAALEDGADMIATGHYARVAGPVVRSAPNFSEQAQQKLGAAPPDATRAGVVLQMAVDQDKDQTYFLYRVTGDALRKTLFPVGKHTKTTVRQMAAERGLATAAKKDSQGICFVGQVGIRDFLSRYVTSEPGDILDKKTGKVVGRHDGAIFYTLGQRRGLDVGGGLPYYVSGKDMAKKEVYVSTDLNDGSIWRTNIELTSPHWIGEVPADGTYDSRIRHRAPLVKADIVVNDDRVLVTLSEPQRAMTSGQSLVLYDGETCLGGGIIA